MADVCVYLVGAGPGDAGLLTLRAKELLEQADCIIYDYLASTAVRKLARADAEMLYVGKKGFTAHIGQEGINELLVQKAEEYARKDNSADIYRIVRLKGGDPFVFGRGGEEALALSLAHIRFEIVPGITSGIAAAAYAGIPVTHRGIASSVTFVTGNEDPTKETTDVDWNALSALIAKGNTVCFYMGMRNLEVICAQLIASGLANETPIALIEWGTTPVQRSVVSDLAHVVEAANDAHIQAPAMIVVGEVARLSSSLSWWTQPPLAGRRFLVTRASKQAGKLSSQLHAAGAEAIEVPLIEFVEPDDGAPLKQALDCLPEYDWVVFTSANGVHAFFDALHNFDYPMKDARALGHAKVAAIGPATASILSTYGIKADIVPDEYIAESVFEALSGSEELAEKRVLIARAQEAREVLPQLLERAGACVDVVPVYRTIVPAGAQEELVRALEDALDGVIFTSSSTVRNFKMLVDEAGVNLDGDMLAFSLGPITSQTLRECGFTHICQAETYTIDGMVDAMCSFFETKEN